MEELQETLELAAETAKSLAAQFTTIWVPIQLALILLAALVGWGIAALVRRRVDLVSLTMGWPLRLRLAVRALIDNLGTRCSRARSASASASACRRSCPTW
jgi:hypothetical protein